jgi:hypothetical protein
MAQNASIDSHGNVVLDVSYTPMEVDSNGVYHQEVTPSWSSIICCLLPAPSFCCGLCFALDWTTTDVNLNAKVSLSSSSPSTSLPLTLFSSLFFFKTKDFEYTLSHRSFEMSFE